MSLGLFTRRPSAVFFDLDGTLADSAAGLADCANDMRIARNLAALPFHELRPAVGSGARGMLGVAFSVMPGHGDFAELRDEFLQRYEQRMMEKTRLFDEVNPMLDRLDQIGMPWGIVTNKALRFAQPMTAALGLVPRTKILVGGDSTAHTKPHPAPLLEAARQLGVMPEQCVYVGDDLRDMQAGRAAGMTTLAAAWGYLGHGANVDEWGADLVLLTPNMLFECLDLDLA